MCGWRSTIKYSSIRIKVAEATEVDLLQKFALTTRDLAQIYKAIGLFSLTRMEWQLCYHQVKDQSYLSHTSHSHRVARKLTNLNKFLNKVRHFIRIALSLFLVNHHQID